MRYLYGSGGRDILDARFFDNYTIYGYSGNDDIYSAPLADSIYGGGGNDRIWSYGGADRIDAGDGFDLVRAGAGNHRVLGGAGDDELYGEDGHDILKGGSGFDDLYGGKGEDVLDGQKGSDYLEGGQGQDIFVFETGSGFDIIGDFTFDADQIYIDIRGIRGYADLKPLLTADGADTVIDFGNGDSLVIENTRPSQFVAQDFVIL